MKKKRGNPKKHWTDVARLKIWYSLLIKTSGMNNNKLGQTFGWRDGYSQTSSTERCMTFYRIESHHQIPKGYDPRWRSMTEIVDAVDQEKSYAGLKKVYTSHIWHLLSLDSISFFKIRDLIQKTFNKLKLQRIDKRKDTESYELLLTNFNERTVYQDALLSVLVRIDDIDALEILALLYLEAKAINSEKTSLLEEILDNYLNDYFDAKVGRFTNNDYYLNAINHLRMISVQLTKSDLNHIEQYKKESMMPVWL